MAGAARHAGRRATGTAHLEAEACRRRGCSTADRLPCAYRPLTVRAAQYNRRAMSTRPTDRGLTCRGAPSRPSRRTRRAPGGGARRARRGRATAATRLFLSSLFPPAPPLPDRPDPLAGFDSSGPLRPVRERAFLLAQATCSAWVVTGLLRLRRLPRVAQLRRRDRSGWSGPSSCSARSSRRAGSAGSGPTLFGTAAVAPRLRARRGLRALLLRRPRARDPRRSAPTAIGRQPRAARRSTRPASGSSAAGTAGTCDGARRSSARESRRRR